MKENDKVVDDWYAIRPPRSSASETAPLSTMAMAMFFGTVTYATVALACRAWSANDGRAIRAAQQTRSTALDVTQFTSVYTLLHHVTIFGCILLYAYLCEYHPPYPHAVKSYDRDEFFFLTALLILVSLFTLKPNVDMDKTTATATANGNSKALSSPTKAMKDSGTVDSSATTANPTKTKEETITNGNSNAAPSSSPTELAVAAVAPPNDMTEVLNRDQTEEWKGWMQFMFLLYHYYHAEEVYNAIRIMITCYVWMTGFGNFSFFYLKADYSATRVLQMLWRLNFLVFFLCLSQGTTYILYYICLLHTFFFVMVYVSMRVKQEWNYDKWALRIKLACLAVLIYLIWDVNLGLFRLLHLPFLGETPMLGATSGAMWEWYFRSSLDHWSTFLGMVFALNFPITSLFFRKLEAQPLFAQVAAKTVMGAALFAAFYAWVTGPFRHGKLEYNATNAYYGFIPLIAYIYFRNLTPWLRSHSLDLLHQIGKTTLETYLMQHHIWLTSNAKSLLTLIPGWPKMNFLVVTTIYFVLSRRLFQLTLFLRGMILPNDKAACIRNLAGMLAAILASLSWAGVLRLAGLLNLYTVALSSVGFGYLLYKTIVERIWSPPPPCGGGEAAATTSPSSPTSVAAAVPSSTDGDKKTAPSPVSMFATFSPALGALAVLSLGLLWNHMARVGAAKIQPLPKTCESLVQRGDWIHVDACNNEEARGAGYRNFDVASLGTCSARADFTKPYVWGWEATPSATHCRFVSRDTKTLQKALQHRRLIFVGDSVVRNLYHATCRAVGDGSAGIYNTTLEKHADITNTYGKKVQVSFQWAPYTTDLIQTLQMIRQNPGEKPDLVVAGVGSWDCLHKYSTDADRMGFEHAAQELSKEMNLVRTAGIPVAWMTPTTINTWGLLTDEKRSNMREDQLEGIRTVQKAKGLHASSSFVLDGPGFTASRVREAYDGVHYPHAVYDGGAQILANAMDWLLLPKKDASAEPFVAPKPGKMAKPHLGLMMLCLVCVGLFLCDGFVGASYLAGIFAPSCAPNRLYKEAFDSLHARKRMPPPQHTPLNNVVPMMLASCLKRTNNNNTTTTTPTAAAASVGGDTVSVCSEMSSKSKDNGESGGGGGGDEETQSFLDHVVGVGGGGGAQVKNV